MKTRTRTADDQAREQRDALIDSRNRLAWLAALAASIEDALDDGMTRRATSLAGLAQHIAEVGEDIADAPLNDAEGAA